MKLLALELSSGQGSIAFRDGDREIFIAQFANDRKHSGAFFENLERCLGECGNPTHIVVGLGPGSYAGARIAIATATGLQAALNAELIGLPSFRALATEAAEYTAIGDARRQSFWFANVRDRTCVEGPTLCTREELIERLAIVSHPICASETLTAFSEYSVVFPSARVLAEIASTSRDVISAPLEPLYLREPHITQPRVARV